MLLFLLFVVYIRPVVLDSLGNLPLVSDLLPEHCNQMKQYYVREARSSGILPHCSTNFKTEKCSNYFNPKLQTYYTKALSKPTCDKDGTFFPKQCKGDPVTGRCFCYNSGGKSIYGMEWWSKSKDMTCACSLKKYLLSTLRNTDANYLFFNSLHCDTMGNYEPFQCDAVSQQCWCADEKTGKLKSTVVPSAAMNKLPCYKSSDVGIQYLRQCENQKFAQKYVENLLRLHGTFASFGDFVCDEDGAYGSYAVIDGATFCTWRDQSRLGSYQNVEPDRSKLNCNCARDKKIYSLLGKQHNLICTPNGNYQLFQQSTTGNFCVDRNGFKSSFSSVSDEESCKQYMPYDFDQ